MGEEKAPQGDPQAKPRPKEEEAPAQPAPAQPKASGPSKDAGWAGAPTSQVVRTVAAALLTVVVVLLFVVGIFLPLLVDQVNGLTKFVNTAAQAPEGPTEYIKGLAKQNGLGGLLQRFDAQLADLRKQLGEVVGNLFSATGQVAISAASFLAALATVLTLTFFLILGSHRYVDAGVGLFAERHQPLVRRILGQAAGAVSGYVTGNLAI